MAELVTILLPVLKRNTRPASAVTAPKTDPKGPGPMDIDCAHKGKTVPLAMPVVERAILQKSALCMRLADTRQHLKK
jgi:hypothetical protein